MFNIENLKKNISKNLSFVFLKQVAFVVLNFISKTVFILSLGKELLGINSLFNNVMTIFSVVEFGISNVFTYYMYEPLKSGNKEKIISLYNYFKKLYLKISFILFAVMLFILPVVIRLTNTRVNIKILALYYFIYILSATINNIFYINYAVFTANQEEYFAAKIQTIIMLIFYSLQIIFVLILKSMAVYLIFYLLYVSFFAYIIFLLMKKKYTYLNIDSSIKRISIPKYEIMNKVKNATIIYLSDTILNSSDSIIISIFMGASILGVYSNYEFIMMGINVLILSLFKAITANLGHAFIEKGNNKKDIYLESSNINNYVALMCASLYVCLSQDFIRLWIGNEYILKDYILFAGGSLLYFRIVKSNLESFKDAAGMFDEMKKISVITSAIKIILSVILIKYLNLYGVVLATSISILITSFWYYPYKFAKELFCCSFAEVIKIIIKNLIISIIICLSCYYTCQFISFKNLFVSLFCKSIFCFIYINILYFIVKNKAKKI